MEAKETAPGSACGQPREQPTARIAYVDFDGRDALWAATEIPPDQQLEAALASKHCTRMFEAVNRICNWLEVK